MSFRQISSNAEVDVSASARVRCIPCDKMETRTCVGHDWEI